MEILYSETILAFLKKVKVLAFKIMAEEMGLTVKRSRVHWNKCAYPIHFIVFDHPSRLGHFLPSHFEIGINKLYLTEKEEEIQNLLRHELAHFLTFLEFGENVPSHGKEYRSICKRFGWPSEISKAHVPIEKAIKNHRLAKKIKKLLALSESHRIEEAKAATLKAQELLVKHQLSPHTLDEETSVKRVLKKTKSSAKLHAIGEILRTFLVYPVFNHGQNVLYLEIVGEKINVEIGEYVAHFLDHHFELLWKEGQKKSPHLKGLAAKNSFFRGLAKGFITKEKTSHPGLIRIEKELEHRVFSIYPHLSQKKSYFRSHTQAESQGAAAGRQLTIREGLSSGSLAINHQKH
ncbi:MAG: DUF2786 domain-containing protein [Chlamydiia bacterium]|nr:DUF2786 domain-containing protein [Chlamydiia bacterium]